MIISSHAVKGMRPSMEDYVMIVDKNKYSITGIFDGHGGYKCAKMLQREFVPIFEHNLRKLGTIKLSLKVTIEDMHSTVCDFFILDSGSTCNIVVVNKLTDIYHIANLGDSRAFVCRFDDTITETTKDHKPNDKHEKIRIRKRGGFVEDNRVNGILAMSRAVGDRKISKYLSREADIYQGSMSNCKFILQASDGLFDVMTNAEVCRNVNLLFSLGIKCHAIVRIISDYAIRVKGSTDNVSVILISRHCDPKKVKKRHKKPWWAGRENAKRGALLARFLRG